MHYTFNDAIAQLGADAVFQYANELPVPAGYLFNSFLPETNQESYTVDSGEMTVRTTMAGLTGTDSPYPPGGLVELSTFLENAAKIANHVPLTEKALRRIQALQRSMGASDSLTFITNEMLNFMQKVIVQAHIDTFEWLRAQALVTGQIDWTFNNVNLTVDYGIPAEHFMPARTLVANDTWDDPDTPGFWADIRELQRILRYNVRALILHPTTLMAIIDNDANKIEMVAQSDVTYGIQRYTLRRLIGNNERPDSDARGTIELLTYGGEGELIDPANPGQTLRLPYMPAGKILAIAHNNRTGYRVGEGATPDPLAERAIGYTHIAPTVEGNGTPGRWAQLYTPENLPMQLHGRAVTNGLPVIENPAKIAIATSELN